MRHLLHMPCGARGAPKYMYDGCECHEQDTVVSSFDGRQVARRLAPCDIGLFLPLAGFSTRWLTDSRLACSHRVSLRSSMYLAHVRHGLSLLFCLLVAPASACHKAFEVVVTRACATSTLWHYDYVM
jgi:hypothetical protein